jgi:hypothetical protein
VFFLQSGNKNKKNTKKSKWLALLLPEILLIKVATMSEGRNKQKFQEFPTSYHYLHNHSTV